MRSASHNPLLTDVAQYSADRQGGVCMYAFHSTPVWPWPAAPTILSTQKPAAPDSGRPASVSSFVTASRDASAASHDIPRSAFSVRWYVSAPAAGRCNFTYSLSCHGWHEQQQALLVS